MHKKIIIKLNKLICLKLYKQSIKIKRAAQVIIC